MKIYFYTHEFSINKDTLQVPIHAVHVSTNKPTGDYGEVYLHSKEVEYTPVLPVVMAERATEMLEAKANKLKAETTDKLNAIAEQLVVYKMLEAPKAVDDG